MQQSMRNRRGERGVSFLLVVAGIFSILAMAALAVDVATLYAANSDAQKAADAAALAGAKMFVTSSSTSNTGGTYGPPDICTSGLGNSTMANVAAQAAAQGNTVGGATAQITALTCTTGAAQNPRIKVTVGRTDLPLFFGRIFGNRIASVSASATAEAYNNSGAAGTTWVQTGSVKPWLVVNTVGTPNYFFQAGTNDLNAPTTYLGKPLNIVPYYLGAPPAGGVRAYLTSPPAQDHPDICPSSFKPSCGGVGGGGYLDQIACANRHQIRCGDALTISDQSLPPVGAQASTTNQGVDCLIHAGADGLGNGQDVVNLGPPVAITIGTNNPNTSIPAGSTIGQSDSVITVPVFNLTGADPCISGTTCGGKTETVIGFLQLGVLDANSTANPNEIETVVLNAVGCNAGGSGTAVSGGGISPIPVRLIQ